MTNDERHRYVMDFSVRGDPTIAVVLRALEDVRARTLRTVHGLDVDELDALVPGARNSIGSLLYHVAMTEMEWLFTAVLQTPFSKRVQRLLPHSYTDANGDVTSVTSWTLDAHAECLAATRAVVVDAFSQMELGDYRRIRACPRYDVTPEWVLHHLVEHEAHHRGQIAMIRATLMR